MPIIHAEGFLEPPCLTLPGEPLVLQERVEGGGTDNEPITLNLLPLVPEFINTEFHIYSFCTFKIFVRSRRDQEKKYRIGIRHSPSTDRYVFEKIVAFYSCPFALSCPPLGGKEKRGEGKSLGGRGA